MKKSFIIVLLLISTLAHLSAIEPAKIISLALPGIVQISAFYDISAYNIANDLNENELFLLTIPQQVCDKKIKLKDAFSLKAPLFAYDVYEIYASKTGFKFLSGDGILNISREADLESGMIHLNCNYEGISLKCNLGDEILGSQLSGSVDINFSFFEEEIASLEIKTNNVIVSGDKKDSNGSVEIVFNANEDVIQEYQNLDSWNAKQDEAINLIKGINFIGWDSIGLADTSNKSLLQYFKSNRALDLVDCLTIYCIEKEKGLSEVMEAISRTLNPVMYVDGEVADDIKLSTAIDVFNLVIGFIF